MTRRVKKQKTKALAAADNMQRAATAAAEAAAAEVAEAEAAAAEVENPPTAQEASTPRRVISLHTILDPLATLPFPGGAFILF